MPGASLSRALLEAFLSILFFLLDLVGPWKIYFHEAEKLFFCSLLIGFDTELGDLLEVL